MKAESPALSFYSCPTAGMKQLRHRRFYTPLKGRVRDMKELVRLEGITKLTVIMSLSPRSHSLSMMASF